MDYNFSEIEPKWQKYWRDQRSFKAENNSTKPKYYVLDMFPYPSGAGLHVGHPLGYIASDIFARYKKLKGYNVLHPMGFDAFGLPAEQYAIQTGRHPEATTHDNIERYKEQLRKIGFAYDWDRMVNTSDPAYYRWTQWFFLQLFHHWYDPALNKARPISELIAIFETSGNRGYDKQTISGNVEQHLRSFGAQEWLHFSEKEKSDILMCYRLAYQTSAYVNWCEALGTVLANDEVKDGVSERGGHPVERRLMRQWFLRITAYAERLHNDLDSLDWSDSMKEMQRNWIGRSEGALINFKTLSDKKITVFTTRPDTIFGVSFLVLAPESDLAANLITPEQKTEAEAYINEAKNRSERERMADVKNISGVFTGSYATHPFTGEPIPVWISDYVLAGYGTGAVMAVPGHDARDHRFAKHFGLPILHVIESAEPHDVHTEAYEAKQGKVINSNFLNGLPVQEAIQAACQRIAKDGHGESIINYRLRDANFSRQRYWGEPFPIYYKDGIPTPLPYEALPLKLPQIEDFRPTGKPEGPLAKLKDWTFNGYPLETDTMPGFAGSSWYFLRYMDPDNSGTFASQEALNYWREVDLYIGGTEHAVGHLLYSRFWHKFLYDLGMVPTTEPFSKLVNQGMIQGRSNFVYRLKTENTYVSAGLKEKYDCIALHVDVNIVSNDVLDIDKFKAQKGNEDAKFILENDKYVCGWEIEKMSKSKYNVVNPDSIIAQYGADTLRLYEMFLGPVEQSKPWNTSGIEGVFRFLRKFWNLTHREGQFTLSNEAPTAAELKILHKTIQQITRNIENFSFNTCVSAFMICVNELHDLGCRKRAIIEPLCILLSPFAPHIADEIWSKAGHSEAASASEWPQFNEQYLVESTFDYPVSVNGKTRFNCTLDVSLSPSDIEEIIMADERTQRWLEGKSPKKVIIVPKRIINIVV
jgi:leucyl-tRNA synthetase